MIVSQKEQLSATLVGIGSIALAEQLTSPTNLAEVVQGAMFFADSMPLEPGVALHLVAAASYPFCILPNSMFPSSHDITWTGLCSKALSFLRRILTLKRC